MDEKFILEMLQISFGMELKNKFITKDNSIIIYLMDGTKKKLTIKKVA